MKFSVRLVIVSLLLVLVLTGCGSIQMTQTSTDHPSGSFVPDVNQAQDKSAMLNPKNRNAVAFKNMGDLAFVWQGLLYVLDGKTGEVKQLTNSGNALHPVWSHDGEWIGFISANSPMVIVANFGLFAGTDNRLTKFRGFRNWPTDKTFHGRLLPMF